MSGGAGGAGNYWRLLGPVSSVSRRLQRLQTIGKLLMQTSNFSSVLQDATPSPIYAPLPASPPALMPHFTSLPVSVYDTPFSGPWTPPTLQSHNALYPSSFCSIHHPAAGTYIPALGNEIAVESFSCADRSNAPVPVFTSQTSSMLASPSPVPNVRCTARRTRQVYFAGRILEPTTIGPEAWRCMHCDYVQNDRLLNNFKRHIATHYPLFFVCKGIPFEDAWRYGGIPDINDMDMVEWDGKFRIGGCFSGFSRRDALLRHLNNPNVSCVGDIAVTTRVRKSATRK